MRLLHIIGMIGIFALLSHAEKTAVTDDGKKVVLHDNGTWEYQEEQSAAPAAQTESEPKRIRLVDIIQNDTRFDFRQVRWGMSKKEVMGAEKAQLVKNNADSLIYTVEFLGYECSVVYAFSDAKLSSAVFLIQQSHVDPALFYKDFDELKKYLSPIYGNPSSNRFDWKNDIYKNDQSKYGFAISIGFLTCRTEWRNERTTIELRLTGSNHQISTTIEYSSIVK